MEKASGFTNGRTVTEIAGLALHYLTTVVRTAFGTILGPDIRNGGAVGVTDALAQSRHHTLTFRR